MISKILRFSVSETVRKINEIVDFVNGLSKNSGDGLIEVRGSRSPTLNINMDRLRARIPKLSKSSGGIIWAYCAANAGTGSTLACYINIPEWSLSGIYNEGDIVIYNSAFFESRANNNSENTPIEGAWWTAVSGGNVSVRFTLLGGISNLSDGHLSLVTGTPIPVMIRGSYWWCLIPIEGTEDCE